MRDPTEIRGTTAREIATIIEERILAGNYRSGEVLLPIRRLAVELGVNPNTVAAAYRLLHLRGLVVAGGRRGTRVRSQTADVPRSAQGPIGTDSVRDLSRGSPDPALLPPIEWFIGHIARQPVLYGDPAVSTQLLEFARAHLTSDGISAEHITITHGTLDGIGRVLAAHLRPGDAVALEDPGWANLLDLVASLGLRPEPLRMDDEGAIPDDVAHALEKRVRALVLTCRAQNPTGSAISEARAQTLRKLLGQYSKDLLLVENDYGSDIAGVPLHTMGAVTSHWAFLRSPSKAYGPDLRLAILAGDSRTVEHVRSQMRLGPRWVSHVLQDLALAAWTDKRSGELVRRAQTTYQSRRRALISALNDRGVVAHGRSGLNVWVPVGDEAVAVAGLIGAGWAVAPGSRFRISTAPAIRITAAALRPNEIEPLADAVVRSTAATDGLSV